MENKKVYELGVVIPVYNEEKAISNVLDKWVCELDNLNIYYQIHVYNDGSKDNTLEILIEYAEQCNRLIVHNKNNSGHGPTILLGYRENSDKKWIFQTDSDDEMGPESFHKLWEKREGFDFLIGIRKGRKSPLIRKIISFISRSAVRIFYGRGVYDVNSPYRLMRTEMFREYFDLIPSDTFAPNVIISGIACMKKFRVFEIPVDHIPRKTGEVSIKRFRLIKSAVKSFIQTVIFRIMPVKEGKNERYF